MFNPKDLTGFGQSQVEKSVRLSSAWLAGADRMMKLNMEVARSVLADNTSTVKALAEVKDVPGMLALQQKLAQPAVDKSLSVAKSVYEAGTSTQNEFTQVVEESIAEFSKTFSTTLDSALKSAPPGSEIMVSGLKSAVANATSAYGTIAKTAKKAVIDLTQAGVAAAEVSAKAAASVAAAPTGKKAAA